MTSIRGDTGRRNVVNEHIITFQNYFIAYPCTVYEYRTTIILWIYMIVD